MVSGFFLGGAAEGFNQGEQQIYQQGILKLAQQRQQAAEKQQAFDNFWTQYNKFLEGVASTVNAHKEQLSYDHPDMPADSVTRTVTNGWMPAFGHTMDQLTNMADKLGIQGVDVKAQVSNIFSMPSAASQARAEKAATGELAKTQAQTTEAQARAGYYERGGLPNTNPDLDTETQLGGAAPSSAPKKTDAGASVLNGLAKSSGMTSEALDVNGRALAGGNTSVLQNLGRGKQGGEAVKAVRAWAAYTLMHDQGLTAQQAAEQLNFNIQNFKGQTSAQQTIGKRAGQFALAENEFEQVSGLVVDASRNVPRSQYKSINDVLLAWREGAGDPGVVQLGAAINSAVNVYARAISPTGNATVSDKDHAREILQKGWSNGQIEAAMAQLNKEVAAAKKSIPAAQQSLRPSGGKPQYKFNPDTGELE